MARSFVVSLVILLSLTSASVSAQIGDGSLRGYVKDQQGGILPGVTVTATSSA